MPKTKSVSMIHDPIPRVLLQLVIPAFIAQLVFVVFNMTNTYFVGQLGTNELAILGFCTTIGFFIQVVLMGIGNGSAVVIAHAIGRGEGNAVEKILTSCLILSAIAAILICSLVLIFDNTIFTLQGMEPELQPMAASYMRIWCVGTLFWLVPMVGNNAIRATGDSRTASKFTIIMVIINMVLDPLLIVGWGPFPALGINGAAIDTLISRFVIAAAMTYILTKNFRMISFKLPEPKLMLETWKQTLKIGLPISITKSIMPLSIGYITSLIAQIGTEAVAARSITGKVQSIAMALIQAIVIIMPGYIGQNLGAGKIKRAIKGVHILEGFVIIWELLMWGLLALIGPTIVRFFSDDPSVVRYAVMWISIVPPFLGFLAWILIGSTGMNAIKKPTRATVIYIIRMVALNIPLAYILFESNGIKGVYWARALSLIIGGLISFAWLEVSLRQMKKSDEKDKKEQCAAAKKLAVEETLT